METLRWLIKPGQTIYSIIRSVSASGMSRCIDFYTIERYWYSLGNGKYKQANRMRFLTGYVSYVLGLPWANKEGGIRGGLRVNGCGMDMAYHCVYELGAKLWPKGTRKPHSIRNGKPDTDGGYALKSEIL